MGYFSSVEEISVSGILTFPDLSTEQIILPSSFKLEEIGTYELEIFASKEGYISINKKEQFGVIEDNANIGYVVLDDNSNISYLSVEDKNIQNDSILFNGVNEKYFKKTVYITCSLIAIIIILIIILKLINGLRNSQPLN